MRKFLLLSIFIATPSVVFGANDMYTVHAWGYGDLLYNVLMSIKTLVGSGSYQRMLSIALLIGALVAVLSLMNAKDFSVYMVAQKIIAGILLYTFIMFSPHDIFIKDHTTGKNYEVRGVPSMVGFPLMLFSSLERGASEIFRTSLASTPGGLADIGAVPVITGYDLLYTTSNYRIQDPNFNRTMSEFVQNCVYPDVLSGYIDIGALVGSNTFWSLLNNTHPARVSGVFGAGASGIDGNLIPCPQVYVNINATLDKYVGTKGTAKKQLASAMGFLADDQIDTILGAVSKQAFNYQQSGQNFLRNAIALNNFNDAYAVTAQQVGMDTSGIAYGVAKGSETAATQMTLSGIMAKKYMPISKGFMTVIMIAIIPLIMLIGLATNSIRKPVGMIVGILTALSLWAIGSQLLDFFIMIRTKSLMSGVENGVYSMATKPIVEQGILDSINMAMSMYWMIPTLSFAVASMSGYSASQMMSGVGATANSAIGGTAGEVATGSASYGVTRTNMMSANKYDGVSSMRVGSATQLSGVNSTAFSNDKGVSANESIEQIESYKNKKVSDTLNSSQTGDENIEKNNNIFEALNHSTVSTKAITEDVKKGLFERSSTYIDKKVEDTRDETSSGSSLITGNKKEHNDTSTVSYGNITNNHLNEVNNTGGVSYSGINAANEEVRNGNVYQKTHNNGKVDIPATEAFLQNLVAKDDNEAQLRATNSYGNNENSSSKVGFNSKLGLNSPFGGFGVASESSQSGGFSLENNISKTTNERYEAYKGVYNSLEQSKQQGDFNNDDGRFDEDKYNQAFREKYEEAKHNVNSANYSDDYNSNTHVGKIMNKVK